MNVQLCREAVHESFEVTAENRLEGKLEFILGPPKRGSLEESLEKLYPRLVSENCYPLVEYEQRGLVLYLHLKEKKKDNLLIHLVLAVITFLSVYLSGLALSAAAEKVGVTGGIVWSSLAYTLGLLIPILFHELGHWIVMRHYSVPASLPYLIPGPPLQLGFLGTLGAVINVRWLPPTADSLALIGIAGPLAGYIVAFPLAVYGIYTSIPLDRLPEDTLLLGIVPLSFKLLQYFFYPENKYILLNSLAFASYVAFFITFLNLIPVALFDGGHIIRGIAGDRAHRFISIAFVVLLLILAPLSPSFMLFVLIVLIMFLMTGGRHPGPALLIEGSRKVRIIVGLLYGVLFVLTFPVPA